MRSLLRPLFFCLFLLPVVVFYGCSPQPKPVVYLPEDFKAYTDFPVGSWWVYENTANPGQRDSFYVVKRTELTRDADRGRCNCHIQRIDYLIARKAASYLDTLGFVAQPEASGLTVDNPAFSYRMSHKSMSLFGLEMLFSPGQVGDSSSYEYGPRIVDRQNTLQVRGKHYSQTITTLFTHSEYDNFIRSETYARGVGVVRRAYFDGRLFELVNYHIPQ